MIGEGRGANPAGEYVLAIVVGPSRTLTCRPLPQLAKPDHGPALTNGRGRSMVRMWVHRIFLVVVKFRMIRLSGVATTATMAQRTPATTPTIAQATANTTPQ